MIYFLENDSSKQTQIYIRRKKNLWVVEVTPQYDESKIFGPYRSKVAAERKFVKLIRKHLANKKRGLTHVGFL